MSDVFEMKEIKIPRKNGGADMEYVTLNNGARMPVLGYGVYQVSNEECERCVLDAISEGGRDIIGTNQRKPSKIKGSQMI